MNSLKIVNSFISEDKFNDYDIFDEYLNSITKNKKDLFISSRDTPWIRYEKNSYVRFPIYNLTLPKEEEISELFKNKNCYLISYNLDALNEDSQSYIYLCRNSHYSFENLPSNMQRNIKKARKEFDFKEVNKEEFFIKGFKSFHDTRKRIGLNDYTKNDFIISFNNWSSFSCNKIFGVFKGEELAAFITASEIGSWAEIGLFSQTNFLNLRPNDLLVYNVIKYYLIERHFDFVGFGLSSIQLNQNRKGLHQFKVKVGFEAIPVKRVFQVNNKLFFLKSFYFKVLIKALLKLFPKSRKLKKIEGVLAGLS